MSLRTGTELITLSLLLNKLSGIYGLLAIFTGVSLSPLQLSMYLYSVLALVVAAYLSTHIRKQSPVQCVALAWFYMIDSVTNACYTAAFALTWFLVISQHQSGQAGSVQGPGNAGKTIDETAGFTSPEYNVTHVDVIVKSADSLMAGQDAVVVGAPASGSTGTKSSLGHAVLQPESMTSITVICTLWIVRIYFILVVMSYARSVLRQHIPIPYNDTGSHHVRKSDSSATTNRPNPFAQSSREGQGWTGRLGRIMVAIGYNYWLGIEDDDGWAIGLGGKFRRDEIGGGATAAAAAAATSNLRNGVKERERRRRSGTGPPRPGHLQVPRWQPEVP